jgi:hypothetical protein
MGTFPPAKVAVAIPGPGGLNAGATARSGWSSCPCRYWSRPSNGSSW